MSPQSSGLCDLPFCTESIPIPRISTTLRNLYYGFFTNLFHHHHSIYQRSRIRMSAAGSAGSTWKALRAGLVLLFPSLSLLDAVAMRSEHGDTRQARIIGARIAGMLLDALLVCIPFEEIGGWGFRTPLPGLVFLLNALGLLWYIMRFICFIVLFVSQSLHSCRHFFLRPMS